MSPRRWTALALVAGSLHCVSWPDDVMGGGKRQTDRADDDDNASPPTPTALPGEADGAAPPRQDAGPVDCPAQAVEWAGDGGALCQGSLDGGIKAGASVSLVDSVVRDTGKVTLTCTTGALTLSNVVCEPPRRFDLANANACGNGFCGANTLGTCATPNLAVAKELCVRRGYAEQTAFTTGDGPNGGPECAPDGVSCSINQNPSCNIIFTSITCRH